MSDPIAFPSSTPGIGLPLLIAGQTQKEFFVNQSLCLLDALHFRAVIASQPVPPASALEGDCFRVTGTAQAAWVSHEGDIAVLIGGDWHFIAPREGMQIFDRAAGTILMFRTEWERAIGPVLPTGGTVIDAEARAAIAALTGSLEALGLIARPTS